jgi:hypothetical protein
MRQKGFHAVRLELQLGITSKLACLAELIELRRKEWLKKRKTL